MAVRWRDAYGGGDGWIHEYEVPDADPVEPMTVGFLLPPDTQPGYLVIADTFFDDGDGARFYSGFSFIPSSMVIDITVM